ncbi:MAG: Valine--tRNA ligase [candidate division WS2 bacterium ADurb.Bin280]|uniref:Valine--tRNA ligase n=1 Tax=candidate division WS2 bacterium ADurb.Bin280 TaxID=1852829 RepID=A0A1V5SGU2_9BACT|nr:MAG: Valine--tRNA ligase [candidate division WS2 bacterium ADurb.Bin280]
MKEIPPAYNPQDHEAQIYSIWEKSGAFTPEVPNETPTSAEASERDSGSPSANTAKKPFAISMPPPNVTGKLHIGHALFITIQDIMTRYHRMKGEPTLWLPGTDHAGIATQSVVDKALQKKGTSRRELGREKFVEEVWKWKQQYGDEITRQLRSVGASCDWSRERFTLDEGLSRAVSEAFKRLYDKGLIYQGLRTVNWCPKCHTAIADDEVEYKKETGKFYHIKYGPFTLATARPETKLGDTAVAVHPSDKRYKEMVGKKYMIKGVLGDFEIEVVADNAADPKFGTGAIKVTPAHSLIDFEIAQRHNLPIKQVIDENGRMMQNTGKYAGMKTREAREAIVEDMQKMGLIEKIDENYQHNIAVCYRCGGQIEPIPSKQWFVKMRPLAEKAKKAVESGEVKIVPKRFEKVYFQWMDNIRDWCISRQLWWGHRIPVWYYKQEDQKSKVKNQNDNEKIENPKIYVGTTPPPDPENWIQDEDVLDTWFSSALWPFSTLGWPDEQASDYKYFYPTSVMETGYDILFFWVARMVMMGLELTDKPPFKTVYLHGLVRDEQNRKMSKSLGNVLDPLDVSAKFGTDAMRMALVVGTTAGNDIAVGEGKIKGYRNFSNKLWNIARFVISNIEDGSIQINDLELSKDLKLSKQDEQDIKKFKEIAKKTTEYLDKFQFSRAGEMLYDFTWHEFADKIIEQAKDRLNNGSEEDKRAVLAKLLFILKGILGLLHPFIPFVTEAIWQIIPKTSGESELLISHAWPTYEGED